MFLSTDCSSMCVGTTVSTAVQNHTCLKGAGGLVTSELQLYKHQNLRLSGPGLSHLTDRDTSVHGWEFSDCPEAPEGVAGKAGPGSQVF